MRKYVIKGLEICNGFLLLSALYCCVMQQIITNDLLSFFKSLLLIPLVGILSVSVEKVKHFWQYLLIAVVSGLLAAIVAGSGFSRFWMGVCAVIAAFSYFAARAGKRDCWLDLPAYPWLIVYFLMYLLGNHFNREFLTLYASFGAGAYFLVCNLHTNMTEMDAFVKTHSTLERLPVKRLGRINSWMMWLQSGFIVCAMLVAPYLGVDQLIRQAGRALRNLIAFLLSRLPTGGQEEMVQEATENMQEMMMQEPYETSAFMELLYKILDIIGWLLALGILILFIRMIIKKIYEMYQQFNSHTEENGDRIERLIAAPSTEKKRTLNRQIKENLFWDRSPSGRMRKLYKNRVLKELKNPPKSYQTPEELEKELDMEEEKKESFHYYYEKARYGKRECTKEDLQNMMKL